MLSGRDPLGSLVSSRLLVISEDFSRTDFSRMALPPPWYWRLTLRKLTLVKLGEHMFWGEILPFRDEVRFYELRD